MESKVAPFSERRTSFQHEGYSIKVSIWNEHGVVPQILFDYNNVLNAYTPEQLRTAANVPDVPYAIVSLLRTTGDNYEALKQRAQTTGETIVALTVKIHGQKEKVETCMKYKAMKLLRWGTVKWAFDDKPHIFYSKPNQVKPQPLPLDHNKKPVYLIPIKQ